MCTKAQAIAIFEKLDKDGNGQLTAREIVEGFEAEGIDRSVACGICVDLLEDDADKMVSKDEFIAHLKEDA